jgi:ParB-like chromosome segregation protein Spo0J
LSHYDGKDGVRVSYAREAQDPVATPQLAELDRLIAGHAFDRAAAAFADAVAAAREQNLGKARKLAAEAADHLATAERAQNGLGFRTYPPPTRDPSPGDL